MGIRSLSCSQGSQIQCHEQTFTVVEHLRLTAMGVNLEVGHHPCPASHDCCPSLQPECTLGRNPEPEPLSPKPLGVPDIQKQCGRINVCRFKLLGLGVICEVSKNSYHTNHTWSNKQESLDSNPNLPALEFVLTLPLCFSIAPLCT